MKKIVKKDGKIYEVWSQDVSYRNTTWTEIGTYNEPNDLPISADTEESTDNEEKIVNKRKKREKS